jgi:hypothetical protein
VAFLFVRILSSGGHRRNPWPFCFHHPLIHCPFQLHQGVFKMLIYKTNQKYRFPGLSGIVSPLPAASISIITRLIIKPDPPAQTS